MASIYAAAFTVPAELKVKVNAKAAAAFIVSSGIGDTTLPPLVGVLMKPYAFGPIALIYSILAVFIILLGFYIVLFSYGLATMEKKLDELQLMELDELNDYWDFKDSLTGVKKPPRIKEHAVSLH